MQSEVRVGVLAPCGTSTVERRKGLSSTAARTATTEARCVAVRSSSTVASEPAARKASAANGRDTRRGRYGTIA